MGSTIGLLTGTFDPIHLGHIELAKAAMAACRLDEVWILVNAHPEHKLNVLSYIHRIAMAKLAVEGVPGVRLVDEAAAGLPHTMAGFSRLMGQYPQDRFVFIVGMDTIGRLDSWKDYRRVVRDAAFVVAHRPGATVRGIDDLRRRLGPAAEDLQVQLFDFDDYGAASSTMVREAMGLGGQPEALDERVYEYIVARGLYR